LEQLLALADKFFHISLKGADNPAFSAPVAELLQPDTMAQALNCSRDLLKAHGLDLPASHLGMGFFGLCAVVQLGISQYNRVLDLTPDNLEFQLEQHEDHAHTVFRIKVLRWSDLPAAEGRDEAVTEALTAYYRETIRPMLAAVGAGAGVKPDLVWNQYGARMAFARDFVLENDPREAARARFQADLKLLEQLPAELFGRRRNPFVHEAEYIDSPHKPGAKLMVRSSCCMYYRRENGEKCYNCPILKSGEREALKRKIEEKREQTA